MKVFLMVAILLLIALTIVAALFASFPGNLFGIAACVCGIVALGKEMAR